MFKRANTMDELRDFVRPGTGGTIIELGSRDGHNAKDISMLMDADRVITIEANPECHANIESAYPEFENYNVAISDRMGEIDFYAVRSEFGETLLGQSSFLYKPSYENIADKIRVKSVTMDSFVFENNIDSIEVLKIDVEGATFEVLSGFTKIRMTRLLHIESEHRQFWEGQHLFEDTESFMLAAGYEQVYFAPVWTDQSDTIWRRLD